MGQSVTQRIHVYDGTHAHAITVSSNSTILVFASASVTAFTTPPSDGTNTYTAINADATGANTSVGSWIAKNVSAGTYTITLQNIADIGFVLLEIAGADLTSPVQDHGESHGTGTAKTVSLTLAADGAIYAFWGNENVNAYSSFTTGVTQRGHDSTHYDADGDFVPAVAGSYTVGANVTSEANNHVLVVALKDSSGSPPVFNNKPTMNLVL